MFKRLRERIAEEAIKFPVGQLANNTGKLLPESENKSAEANSTEDLITLSDSSSVVVPHTSPQQFSIGEEEDGSLSEQSTPQKKQTVLPGGSDTYNSKEHHSGTFADLSFGQEYRPSKKLSYVPQSDIESEREDPPTLNLDGISKDQLMAAIQALKARSYKYKNKYAEVVKNFKELREEKVKIETTLIENQDKGLRRIAELREQCQLEQKAKAHLEENLRLLLDEKDSRICVLETQINLLKNEKSGSTKTLLEDCDNQFLDGGNCDTKSEDSITSMSSDIAVLQEKVERLQHQHNQDKKTITAQKDQVNLLRKQNENISQELEEKVKRLNDLEDEQLKLKCEHESVLQKMQDRLLELEKQQEESNMSMAETKRNMHEELELKEKQLVKAEEESKMYQVSAKHEKELVADLKKQHEEQVKDLLYKLELTEKTLEEEKQSLLHELGQGKTAAINLMQQECLRKISAVEDEWKSKCDALQSASQVQMEELSSSLKITEEKLNKTEQRVEELDSVVSVLEKENASLKNSVEKLESDLCLSSANYEKLKASYSDYEALKEKENLLKKQEALNNELNDKIAKYVSTEQDLQALCGSLTQELEEQKNLITNLENYKIDLINKIQNYEVSQKELETHCANLKNEISALNENLKNHLNKIENMTHDNITKLEEINDLQKHLNKVSVNEKLISEKLSMSIAESKEFEIENADLLLNNRLLNDEIENLKNSLRIKEKELDSVNDVFLKSYYEINLLKETVEIKESMLKQAVVSYKQVEYLAESLEQQQSDMKMVVEKFENICKSVFKNSYYLLHNFELIKKSHFESKVDLFGKSDCDILVGKNKTNNDCSKLQELCNKSTETILTHSDHENEDEINVQILLKDISVLKSENADLKEEVCACKTFSELQNIEFAKNITVLQQSLGDLQEERNNLSLVLQNIEHTQMDKSNCEFQNDILYEAKSKIKNDYIDYQRNWEIQIADLNSKVKSEIEALSSQTEIANKELRNLHEQFKSNHDSYSEKLAQLNSRLLHRTEALINLKEDLDTSVQNANSLKELLESTRQELCEKNEHLNSIETSKRELEAKCKSLKEKYFKKECELKETHNSQLIDLKNQTEVTIDKLNEQIKLSSKLLDEKDQEFGSKFASVEQNYQNAISNFQNQIEEVINCHMKLNKLNDISNSFEVDCVSKLDKYCSKITKFGSKINQFISKLQEKDEKIAEQSSSLQSAEEQLKGYDELRKDFNDLKNEFDSTAQLLDAANKELDCEKSKSVSYADETSKLKDDYETALQKIKMFSSNISDKEKLQSLLDTATKKLESLEVEHSETCLKLSNQNRELEEFQEKYQSTLKDSESLNKLLNEEKNKLQIQITANNELSNKYSSFLCEVNGMSAKLNEHIDKSNQLLDEREAQLETVQSKLSSVSSQCESKGQEISDLKSQIESYKIQNSKLKNDYETTLQKNKALSATISNKDELQTLLDISTEKLKILEIQHSETCSKLNDRDAELQEFQEKYESALNNIESLNKRLDEEKNQLHMHTAAICEFSNKYNSIVCEVDGMSSKFNEHRENISRLLDEKDFQLKNVESKLLVILSQCGLKDQEISGLKTKLDSSIKELAVTKDLLAENMKISDNVILEWKAKYENAISKIQEMSLSNEASLEEFQLLLNEKEIQLNDEKIKVLSNEVELEKFKLQSGELFVIQDKLNQYVEELQKCQNLLDEQIQNATALENEKLEWKLKYDATFEELSKVSSASLKDKEDIKQLMLDLDARTIQISAMMPSEKLKELEENQLELLKYMNQVKNLQLKIEALSSSLSEKESVIKRKDAEKENLEVHHEESLKCIKDKLQNAEKNYKTQMEEMKFRFNQLEKENSILVSEKENLLVIQKQFKELKSGEDKIQLELKSKEEELKLLHEKLETTNKEEVEKIHTFQENMKDKDNMILKLKATVESISKEHSENVEELHKKIKRLEVEREQLMLQAQERVSATEAKCREDIKALQEKYDKLLLENKEIEKLKNQIGLLNTQLDESLLVAESNQASATQEISLLKDKLFSAESKLAEVEKSRLVAESELSNKLEKLQQENKLLLCNSDHVEKLKAEKGELNEKLKNAVQQVNKIKVLETEKDNLQKENEKLSKEVQHIRTVQNESTSLKEKLKVFEENESAMKIKIQNLTAENEQLKSEILGLKNSFESEKDSLSLENEKLQNRIQQLENCVSDSQNTSVKDYVDSLKKEYETAIKAKDDEMLCKLKQLVKDFSIQMDVKDKDSEQMIAELIEKNQFIEEKFQREHASAVSTLRKDMLSKDCALEEMREHFEETIQEKDAKIKKLEQTIKSLIPKDDASAEHLNIGSEHSDWDDSWVVPDEVVENSSPVSTNKPCDEHVQQIESLQEELSKSNSEIKELKILLRLSPPDSMVNNNNRRDSVQSLPEPTEFEYLKNIIYEYMMGKEPVTLAKVIAAVLRFSDVQTQQVIRREESRHPAK